MRPRAIIRGITPPFIWDLAKKLVLPSGDQALAPFVHECVGSHSQYAEDLVIDALLGTPSSGVYVDIGANDPEVLSNTKRFYERGWRGINVEPNTALWERLRRERPEDINLNIGVAQYSGRMAFFMMDPSTLSTFSADVVRDNLSMPGTSVTSEVEITVEPLSHVLAQHLGGRAVDLLSVDTEGLDLAVLRSNDWQVFRPRLVLVEVNQKGDETVQYLQRQGYTFAWCNGTNGIFLDGSWKPDRQAACSSRAASSRP